MADNEQKKEELTIKATPNQILHKKLIIKTGVINIIKVAPTPFKFSE